jgi:hypothetical protein
LQILFALPLFEIAPVLVRLDYVPSGMNRIRFLRIAAYRGVA